MPIFPPGKMKSPAPKTREESHEMIIEENKPIDESIKVVAFLKCLEFF